MTDQITSNEIGPNGRRYSPVPCPQQVLLGPTRLTADQPVAVPETYPVGELSHSESARLTRATIAADQALAASHQAIRTAADRLVDAWRHSRSALQMLAAFEAEHSLLTAAQGQRDVVTRHARDGAEDRRHRPGWLHPWLVWAMILASAIYDTVFFATAFRDMIDAPDNLLTIEYWVSYVPGFAIAMALILSGSWLAVPLFRHRHRAERRPLRRRLTWKVLLYRMFVAWRPADERRSDDDLPWPSWVLPVAFTSLVLGVLGIWAWLRGGSLQQPGLRLPMVALLLLLTIAAIAFKASAHNPYADTARKAQQELRSATARYTLLEAQAREKLAAHAKSWQETHTVTEEAAASARWRLMDAWAEIAEERAGHGLTGMVAPRFVSVDGDIVVTNQVFTGMAGPPLGMEVLGYTRQTLAKYHPDLLEHELATLVDRLNEQLAARTDGGPDRQSGVAGPDRGDGQLLPAGRQT
ncbi:hypothetical protein GCM10027290_38450 [Micromonospora sonneratiae]|uniref:DUF4129 domain-containing protein n=1 Tax=Micromonospora sonneratiae TaxID=1184706 RepID=A0ABW3Y9N9_9ACTN